MSVSRLTYLSWAAVILFFGLRTYFSGDPGSELLWKIYFRGEDGIIDRGEAILWVPVIILNAMAFVTNLRRKNRSLTALWHLGLTLGCIVLLGEEISWGQHIIGFESSKTMATINAQQESNFHNLNLSLMLGLPEDSVLYPWLTNFNHVLNPLYYLASCVLFIALPMAKRISSWKLLESIPSTSFGIVAFFFANVVAYLVVDKLIFDVGEIFEFAITTTFALTALESYRQAKVDGPSLQAREDLQAAASPAR